ncbi:hypothetical protein LC586_34635 [Nostoc sp. CHAB 5714]|uniref:Transposase n=1 Tax=Nostoc favosum CHAB5714 TaxID=2780399 RepID=A0ABS8IK65_9NOSO|nr:hypothetical protein [Nostoc favosum CHAB5714]
MKQRGLLPRGDAKGDGGFPHERLHQAVRVSVSEGEGWFEVNCSLNLAYTSINRENKREISTRQLRLFDS